MKTKKLMSIFFSIALTISLSGCAPSVSTSNIEPKIKSDKNVTIFTTTDIHYLSKSLHDNGEAYEKFYGSGDGKQINYVDEIVDAFTRDIKVKRPDILIISGDLTTNGEKESHLDLAKKLQDIEKNGTSVYVIPGNHDVLNPYARSFSGSNQYVADYITSSDFSKIYNDFGYEEAVSRDRSSLSYLAAPSESVWLLMLDTAQYDNNLAIKQPQLEGRITPETFEWIKQCTELAKKNGAQIITVMHHNLLNHSETVRKGFTLNDNKAAIDKFQQYGLKFFLSGHIHIQDIKSYDEGDKEVYDITTSSLAVYPQQYGVIKYSPVSGFSYNTSQVDVEGWARENNIKDSNLTDFEKYSKDFFSKISYNKAYSQLLLTDLYKDDEMKFMSEAAAEFNINYFSGTLNKNLDELKNLPGTKLWLSAGDMFYKKYIETMLKQDNTDDNKLTILKASIN